MKNNQKETILILLCIWTLFIWGNSCNSISISSEKSDWIAEKVGPLLEQTVPIVQNNTGIEKYIVRKAAHLFEFLVLAILWSSYIFVGNTEKMQSIQAFRGWISIILCLATAVIDEMIQIRSPGRTPSWQDILIDLSGSICGLCIFKFVDQIVKRKRRKQA